MMTPDVADLCHQSERLIEFLCAPGRQWHVMGIAADRTVVVIRRNGMEGAPFGCQAPEAATGGLGSSELGDVVGRRLPKRDGDRMVPKLKYPGKALLDAGIVCHLDLLGPVV